MANLPDAERLRGLVGEDLKAGETEDDSLLSDGEIADLLDRHGSVEAALLEAWQMKAGRLANLVNVQDGTSSRALSNLHQQAMEMVEMYTGGEVGSEPSRSRSHRIVRT